MRIRKARKSDIEEISRIIEKEYAKPPYNEKWTHSKTIRTLQGYFKRGVCFVAIADGHIVGFIIFEIRFYYDGFDLFVGELAVLSEYQRKGIGKALVVAMENHARRMKVRHVWLRTMRNGRAYKFYKSLGYVEDVKGAIFQKNIK
jgi:ribosomal protein S18 acetylase RimI-like enzyme